MNRTLGVERVYNLGDYKSLRVSDYFNETPLELMFNTDAVEKIRYLQLVSMEMVYEKYVALAKKLKTVPDEEHISMLIEERANTMEELKQLVTELSNKEKQGE